VIYHVQRLTFGTYVSEEEIEEYVKDIKALECLDRVEKIVIGQDLGNPSGGFEECKRLTVMVQVRDLQGYARYMNDPAHVALANRGSGRMLVQVMNCDLSDDFDPNLRAEMDAVVSESAIDPRTRERAARISV
jgi:Stress responsive A/B Barrel Domain